MCIAPPIVLNFGERGGNEDLFIADRIVVDLTESPDGICVMFHMNGVPMIELNAEQAEAIGWALLSQAAQTRRETHMARRHLDAALHHADRAAQAVTR